MLKTGTLGSLLQGVSQQQPKIRLDGQVTAQINMHSDVVRGLISRPPLVRVATLTGSATPLKFDDIEIDNTKYTVGWRDGVLKVWDTAGTEYTVKKQDVEVTITGATFTNGTLTLSKTGAFAAYSFTAGDVIYITGGTNVVPGPYTVASRTSDDAIVLTEDITSDASSPTDVSADDMITPYLGDNMTFHVYDDTIYVVNNDIIVAEDTNVYSDEFLQGQGLIQALGGVVGRDMTIRIDWSDGNFRELVYTLPNDNKRLNGDDIMERMHDALTTGATYSGSIVITGVALKASTTATRFKNCMHIEDDTFTFTLTCTDGDDGKVLRNHIDTAKKIEDLVRFAPHGTLVEIDGEEAGDDNFWMRFEVENETVAGAGFGERGTWRESVNGFEATRLDYTTMPHVLFKVGSTFFVERNLWQARRVGDSETNPHPSFVGEAIADVGGFQSRLAFVAGPNFVASRTNIPSDFYKKSVVNEADTDPLDFASTTESEVDQKWIIPFDRDLLLLSQKHQFIISGSNALTPKNAGMVLTTDFEMAGQARPSSTGRTVLFPYKIGVHAGIKEFFSSDEIASNGADNITETATKYINGDITQIATSTNFNTAVVLTDAAEQRAYVYKWLWEGIEKKQSSLNFWTFPLEPYFIFWDNETIFAIMRDGTDYILCSMDMDFATHPVGYTPTLDLQTEETIDGSNQVTLDYSGATFVQYTGCELPGEEVSAVEAGVGPYTYTFDDAIAPIGATVIAGKVYEETLSPTMPYARDRNGKAKPNVRICITEFYVDYVDSGTIESTMTSKYRANAVFDNDTAITAGDVEDVSQIGIRSGTFVIPWGEFNDWSELTLRSTGFRPINITEIHWTGQVYMRGN